MKIRTDFVTNSSSSGFVVITVNLENGKKISLEKEYDSGYGGYFWNGGDFNSAFDLCETGTDILLAVISQAEEKGFIETSLNTNPDFKKKLLDLKSVGEIESIQLEETTRFDGGDEKTWKLKYTFEKPLPLSYIKPAELKMTFNNACVLFGDFQFENQEGDCSELKEFLKKNNWKTINYYGGLNGRSQKEYLDYMRNELKLWGLGAARFFVIGDITVQELDAGKHAGIIKLIERLKQEYGVILIKEKDFLDLGPFQAPWDDCSIDSLEEKKVAAIGDFDEPIEAFIHDCGGMIIPFDKAKVSDWDYIVVGNKSVSEVTNGNFDCLHACAIHESELNEKTKVLTEKCFLAKTDTLKEKGITSKIQSISCKGKKFLLTGGAAVGNSLKNYITNRGGILEDGAPSAAKKINYVIYIDYNSKVRKAEELREKGNDISIITVEDFYKAAEQDDSTDETSDGTERNM